ncbi:MULTISPECIES: SAV_6107 family HEPN domain-containing protein [Corynebacterium]|uniref:SAV_6107 family HEPN domain-containing protein n=1 Tax=Corynebacterium TaxID=1716 RepID=UPI00210EBF84|nr:MULTISPECIES: SAV_6107 family HEPN domain-containing protein [Corynebacterium]UUA86605.1 SAV_6107 family HEPN domain-containing protein [Corynebacterium pseudogenitalium]WPJ93229.1 SAV_6107 family HEPN domain-containing protein [Corynebacterium sp. UMB2355A]
MNSVISATTNEVYGARVRQSKRDQFLETADGCLTYAYERFEEGAYDEAMEYAYRAALRTAGAVCSDSPVIQKRKRLPSSAWKKLALTGKGGERWANVFESFSRERGRVASGIEHMPPADRVAQLLEQAEQFYLEALPAGNGVAA